jgi:NAD(P) transhydrogenase subunit alpha
MLSIAVISLIVFVLSCFIGYFVVWGVTPALHTPLMAVTNAISGIVVVAAMTVAGINVDYAAVVANLSSPVKIGDFEYGLISASPWFGFAAVILASINIFGGFAITYRMLAMFKKKQAKQKEQ